MQADSVSPAAMKLLALGRAQAVCKQLCKAPSSITAHEQNIWCFSSKPQDLCFDLTVLFTLVILFFRSFCSFRPLAGLQGVTLIIVYVLM